MKQMFVPLVLYAAMENWTLSLPPRYKSVAPKISICYSSVGRHSIDQPLVCNLINCLADSLVYLVFTSLNFSLIILANDRYVEFGNVSS
jgi:hypothetical protein